MPAPRLGEVMKAAARIRAAGLRVAQPARVERYNPETQLVDVQPLIKEAYEDEDGQRRVELLPVITNVPVVFPGSGGFRITFPVAKGDTVLLIHTDRSLDAWMLHGGEVDPRDDRTHDLTDAVAMVGFHHSGNPWTGVSTNHLTLGADGGAQIHVKADAVHVGAETAVDAAALASKVAAQLQALKAALTAAVPVAAPDGGAGLKASLLGLLANWPAAVGSASLKVKD